LQGGITISALACAYLPAADITEADAEADADAIRTGVREEHGEEEEAAEEEVKSEEEENRY